MKYPYNYLILKGFRNLSGLNCRIVEDNEVDTKKMILTK